jgi:hypothetical protein
VPGGVRLAQHLALKALGVLMANTSDEKLLARNMIDVHGAEATIVRENARGAELAGQLAQARSWIRVLGISSGQKVL